jgi:hypothetical protein
MNRNDINGFTLKFLNYSLEFVTEKHILRCVALWNSNHLIKRFEIQEMKGGLKE